MDIDNKSALNEIKEMLKAISDRQVQLLESVNELREIQKKLQEEISFNNFVLNNISSRSEILN